MCACVCMYVCMCVYVCMHVCMCVYVCMYVCMCVYACVHVCVCMYACVHVCVCMYVCMHVCMCVYVCMYVLRGGRYVTVHMQRSEDNSEAPVPSIHLYLVSRHGAWLLSLHGLCPYLLSHLTSLGSTNAPTFYIRGLCALACPAFFSSTFHTLYILPLNQYGLCTRAVANTRHDSCSQLWPRGTQLAWGWLGRRCKPAPGMTSNFQSSTCLTL
jgi:nuclear pore complex protein Nup62